MLKANRQRARQQANLQKWREQQQQIDAASARARLAIRGLAGLLFLAAVLLVVASNARAESATQLCVVRPSPLYNFPDCTNVQFPGVLHDYADRMVIAPFTRDDDEGVSVREEYRRYAVTFCFQNVPGNELVCNLRFDLLFDSFEDYQP